MVFGASPGGLLAAFFSLGLLLSPLSGEAGGSANTKCGYVLALMSLG